MGSSFCWLKLKDASTQGGGPLYSIMEMRPNAGLHGASLAQASVPARCPAAAPARSTVAADAEVSLNCPCCSNANQSGTTNRFIPAAPSPFESLTAAPAPVWRLEGPVHPIPNSTFDHTLSMSPAFGDRSDAIAWMSSTDGVTWSADAIGLALIAHIGD